WHALLHVEYARVFAISTATSLQQGAPRGHDPVCLPAQKLEEAGEGPRRRLAPAMVGPRHLRKDLAATAPGQAGRQLYEGLGGIHLGHHRPNVRRSPDGTEEGDVRV